MSDILLEADDASLFGTLSQAAEELEEDGWISAFEELDPGPSPVRLPRRAPRPVRAVLQSADLDVRTCEHEIAAALAVIAGEDPVIAEIPAGYVRAAQRVVELVGLFPKCQQKGAH